MKKKYLTPLGVPVLIAEPVRPLCSSELKALEESSDLEDLEWN